MENVHSIINLILKALALAMAVVVIVLGMLDSVDIGAQLSMLGIGLFALALFTLRK